jgi:hypothetical protein
MGLTGRAGVVLSTFAGLLLCVGAERAAAADVVAVVSARSTAGDLTRRQVMDLVLGKATRFPGGRTAVPVDQAEGSAVRDAFYLAFADKSPAQIKAHWSKVIFTGRGQPPRAVASGVLVKKLLAGNADAIGYVERSEVDDSLRIVLSR